MEYLHNPLGQRIAKQVNGQIVEKYHWLNLTTLLATYDANGNVLQRYEYAGGRTPTKLTQGTQTYYILSDYQGTPKLVTDTTGAVVKELSYDSFGNVIQDSNPTFRLPFGYAGGLYDPETQLVRFGHRDYDPDIGRWTARDPIGFGGGDYNLYTYVFNDSVNLTDPYGLKVEVHSRDVVGSNGLAAHTYITVTDKNGSVTTYGSYNVGDMNKMIMNDPSDHGGNRLPRTSSVTISPPKGVSQDQWDRTVMRTAYDRILLNNEDQNYRLTGGYGVINGNCHTTVSNIINDAGGQIPSGYNPPGLNPGL